MHGIGKLPRTGTALGLPPTTKADLKPAPGAADAPRPGPRLSPPRQVFKPQDENPEDLLIASRVYFEILRRDPYDLDALQSAARTSLKLGEAGNAMAFCHRALGLAAADARQTSHLLVIRGVAYRLLGQPVASLEDLRAATSLHPGNREAAQQLALTLGELERPVGAPGTSLENREHKVKVG